MDLFKIFWKRNEAKTKDIALKPPPQDDYQPSYVSNSAFKKRKLN